MPVGRPTAYREEFCEQVIEFGKDGCGRAEIAGKLGVVRDTLSHWEDANPAFLCAMEQAREFSLAWWAEQGRLGVWDQEETIIEDKTKTVIRKRLNANAYSLQVRNRFPKEYRDKTEVDLGGSVKVQEMSDDEKKLYKELAAEFAAKIRNRQ